MLSNLLKNIDINLTLKSNKDWKKELVDDVTLIGDQKFIDKNKQAISTLKLKDPITYSRVTKWIKTLIYFPELSNMSIDPDSMTCYIGKKRMHHQELDWYCCSLAHEATHSLLRNRFKFQKIRPKSREEKICMKTKLRCYQRLGHDFNFDEYINSTMKTKWYTFPKKFGRTIKTIKQILKNSDY